MILQKYVTSFLQSRFFLIKVWEVHNWLQNDDSSIREQFEFIIPIADFPQQESLTKKLSFHRTKFEPNFKRVSSAKYFFFAACLRCDVFLFHFSVPSPNQVYWLYSISQDIIIFVFKRKHTKNYSFYIVMYALLSGLSFLLQWWWK